MERSQSRRSKTRLTSGRGQREQEKQGLRLFLDRYLCLCLCLCLSGLLVACTPASHKSAPPLPRANPGYVQWLERQSMLAASPQYTRLVSGTELQWRLPATDTDQGRIDTLLKAADTWLFVYPPSLLTEGQRSVMAELHTGTTLRQLKMLGIGGVYMNPTAESSALWAAPTSPAGSSGTPQGTLLGEEATSLTFAPHVGTETHYTDLARAAGREQMQLGAGLVPAAIGIGPDFLLAGRHVREYPGTMLMVEVPKDAWHLLPPASPAQAVTDLTTAPHRESPLSAKTWAATALNGPHQASFDALVAKNIIPPALVRDNLPWASPSGWAASPIMEGSDGVERRFVYRYHGHVNSPVLQWDDPSRNTQRILSASAIRTIGSQQQTLGGLYLEAWAGLDVADRADRRGSSTALAEPAAAALRDLSREIRRYGGWSMQADVFPPSLSPSILATGVDFTLDTITSPTAEYALLTGDTLPLKEALKASLVAGVDHKRLVRALPHYKGLDLRPLYDSSSGRAAVTTLQTWLSTAQAKAWLGEVQARPERIAATATTLAAMAAGYGPNEATRPENAPAIRARHMLLTSLRAAMPGLLVLSGADMSGALNVPANTATPSALTPPTSPLGAWGFSTVAQAGISTRTGLARAPSVYGPMQAQAAQADSYAQQLTSLLAQRRQWGLARAELIALPDTTYPTSVALLLRLPDKSYALTVANFSDSARSESVRITAGGQGGQAAPKAQNLRLELDPWQCRLIHMQ